MPVTVCPNCSSAMTEISRRGVFVDVCPNCRGVWLDGGELEKLLATADAGAAATPRQEPRYASREAYQDDHREDYDDRGQRRRKRKRRGEGIFELFEDLFD